MLTNNWRYKPGVGGYPDSYAHKTEDMLVIQHRGQWEAFHLDSFGFVGHDKFVDPTSALSWCEGRMG